MSSEIKKWWDDDKIRWYIRGAASSDFHQKLASILSRMVNKNESIAELGCGLGYLTEELSKLGYNITGYDNNSTVIDIASKRCKNAHFETIDCYTLDTAADVSIALFFGKLTEEENLKCLLKSAKKRLIYITGGGSKRRTSDDEIERALENKELSYKKTKAALNFDQPLLDRDEAERYLDAYYKGTVKEEKRKRIEKVDSDEFGYVLRNLKDLSIYEIYKEI